MGPDQELRPEVSVPSASGDADLPDLADLASLVRSRRLAIGLSQEELAERCGLTERSIRNIERGRVTRPRVGSVHRLADALALPPEQHQRMLAAVRRARRLGTDPGLTRRCWPVPAQLPMAGPFVGRRHELARLHQLWTSHRHGDRERILAITGPPGVGKTALALHWAGLRAGDYPDGQLFVDLGGADSRAAAAPGQALGQLLRSLGVPADRLPAGLAEQAGLYRSLLAGRQVLVVLDDVAGSDQVAPLLPGRSNATVVLTSRIRLDALAARHTVDTIELDVLADDEATLLLVERLADHRPTDPGQLTAVAALCDRLPLALRIAAARLTTGQCTVPQLLGDLSDSRHRLSALSLERDTLSVRAMFETVYQGLRPPAARLFRLLGAHPGPHFRQELAAAIANTDPATGRRDLNEVVAAHLITMTGQGRCRFHDLVRLYARELLQPTEHDAAIGRIVNWYLAAAVAADRHIMPWRHRRPERPAVATPDFASDIDALAWWDDERDNVVPVVQAAFDNGDYEAAWQLPRLLSGPFRRRWGSAGHLVRLRTAVPSRSAPAT